ncbi:MAG: tRNA pseudouridine(13) synthase TruD, partial [Planctomycetota bacterium]
MPTTDLIPSLQRPFRSCPAQILYQAMANLPYMTAELPGIGGRLKRHREDFEVEEIPAYEPSGTGTHTYFCVEKTGLSTRRAVRRIASALRIPPRRIGYAGLKDAQAITRQVLSVEHVDPERVGRLELPSIRVVWVNRHTNKLKLGHLKGNRFIIKVREADDLSTRPVEAILDVLVGRGVPNYFGPQRFGTRGDNAAVGLAAVRGDYDEAITAMLGRPNDADSPNVRTARGHFDRGDYLAAAGAWPQAFDAERRACHALARPNASPEKAWRALDWPTRRLYLAAMQGELFNRVVATRIDSLDRLLPGDLAVKHANQAVFSVTDAAAEQPRCDAFEISPTGPLVGPKMTRPQGEPARVESEILAEAGLSMELFEQERGERIDGARRALRVRPEEPAVDVDQDDHGRFLRVAFVLPAGA